jgi:heat-inducible transcriptional repressor
VIFLELSTRQREILKVMAELYIDSGEAVGSKSISQALKNSISSATIRNELAVLEQLGYTEQLHKSSGRVPTREGMRFYVTSLIKARPLPIKQRRHIDEIFETHRSEPNKIIEAAATLLSQLTNYTVISTPLSLKDAKITTVDLVMVSDKMLAVAIVLSTGDLKTGMCRTYVDGETLGYVTPLVNRIVAGMRVNNITREFINKVSQKTSKYPIILVPVLTTICNICEDLCAAKIMFDGQQKLLSTHTIEDSYPVLELMSDRRLIASLMDASSSGVTIKITESGDETHHSTASLITAKYLLDEEISGSIGIIGPVRMDYARAISYIDYFASALAKLLRHNYDESQGEETH